MKNILIPTDFSDNSWTAIRCALNLFLEQPIHITLLHVEKEYHLDNTPMESETVIHQNISAYKRLERWAHKTENFAINDQQISFTHRSGHFIEEVRSVIKEKDIDLIVMSTKGKNIFNPQDIGQYTKAVITQVACTTLVVPQEVPCKGPKQIALLTDYNFIFKSQALENLKHFSIQNKGHLNVIHLSTNRDLSTTQTDNKQLLKDALTELKHSFHFMINQSLDEALHFFVEVHKVDMIALLAKNLNFSQNLFFDKRDTEFNSYHAKTPFLVIHE